MWGCAKDVERDGLLVKCGAKAYALVGMPGAAEWSYEVCEKHLPDALAAGLVRKPVHEHVFVGKSGRCHVRPMKAIRKVNEGAWRVRGPAYEVEAGMVVIHEYEPVS